MATSGSFSNTFATGRTLKTTWTATQSAENNTSTITAVHTLVLSSSYSLYISTRSNSCTIGGVTKTFTSPAISTSGGTTITLGTTTHTVSHNTDGSLSASGSTTFNIAATLSGTYYASATATGTLSLTTIPRASSISSVTSSVSMTGSNAVTVAISRASSSFTHSVKIYLSSTYQTTVTGVGTSTSYTIPISWNNALPSATSGTVTVTVTTYSGSTQIGSSVSTTFTVTVPTTIVPSFTAVTATRVDGTVPSSWGVYVQGKSKCTLAITGAAGSYSSTIKSYSISGTGLSTSSSSGTTSTLTTSGTITYTAKITDSRGRTASKTVSITVYAYTAPSATGTAYRCNSGGTTDLTSGTYIAITPSGTYSTCNGNNTRTVKYRYKQTGGTDISYIAGTNGTKVVVGSGAISTAYSYTVEITCSDYFTTSSTYTIEVGTGNAMMSFYGKTGSAFGKVAEEDGKTEFGHPVYDQDGNKIAGNRLLYSYEYAPVSGSAVAYTGISLTIPKGYKAIISAQMVFINGAPTAIYVSTSSTSRSLGASCAVYDATYGSYGNLECVRIYEGSSEVDKTYYIWGRADIDASMPIITTAIIMPL